MHIFRLLMISSTLLLGACANTGLYLLNSSLKLSSEHAVSADIQYGEKEWQRLDLHIPPAADASGQPVLVFFYGGSWYTGKKEQYFFAADAFAKLGYLVVIPDYLKAPEAKFPQFIEDGAAAVAWVKNNIGLHGGDPEQVFVAGHSAGAHLGGLLLSDADYLAQHQLKLSDIKGFAGLAGPYNFTPTDPQFIKVFGAENFDKMKMMNYVDGDEPPMMLMHGMKDSTVGVANKDASIERLKAAGVAYKDIEYDKATHVGILLSLTPRFRHQASTVSDIDQFFKSL